MSSLSYRKQRETYYYRYFQYIDGKRRERSIDLQTDSPSKARKMQENLDLQISQGKDPQRLKNVSLAEYLPVLREWKLYRNRSTATIEIHDTISKKLLQSEIATRSIRTLTTHDVERYLRALNYSYSYIKQMKGIINQCLKMAVADGVILRNVVSDIELFWIRQPDRRRAFVLPPKSQVLLS